MRILQKFSAFQCSSIITPLQIFLPRMCFLIPKWVLKQSLMMSEKRCKFWKWWRAVSTIFNVSGRGAGNTLLGYRKQPGQSLCNTVVVFGIAFADLHWTNLVILIFMRNYLETCGISNTFCKTSPPLFQNKSTTPIFVGFPKYRY